MYSVLLFTGREREYECACVYIYLYFLEEVILSENFLKMITYKGNEKEVEARLS